jgi:hypothetical protein
MPSLLSPISHVDIPGKSLKLGGKTGKCYIEEFNGRLTKTKGHGIWAIFVGVVDNMEKGKIMWPKGSSPKAKLRTMLYTGGSYFLFMEYRQRQWQLVGTGIFKSKSWTKTSKRHIITIGEYAQQLRRLWVEDMATKDARRKPFKYHSYGIIPIPNFSTTHYPTPDTKQIQWFGYKGSKVPG